jgi:hypothetical protein
MQVTRVGAVLTIACCLAAPRVLVAKGGGHGGGGHSSGGHSGGGHSGGGHSSGGHASGGHSGGGHSSSGHPSGGRSSGSQASGGSSATPAGSHVNGGGSATGTVSTLPAFPHAHPRGGITTIGPAVPRPILPSSPFLATRWTYAPIFISPFIVSPYIGAAGFYGGGFWPGNGYSDYGYPACAGVDCSAPPPVRTDETAADSGNLRLDVQPASAQVFVDGYFVGSVEDYANTLGGVRLTAGPHRLEFQAPGYQTLGLDVMIGAGRSITFRADLKPQP